LTNTPLKRLWFCDVNEEFDEPIFVEFSSAPKEKKNPNIADGFSIFSLGQTKTYILSLISGVM